MNMVSRHVLMSDMYLMIGVYCVVKIRVNHLGLASGCWETLRETLQLGFNFLFWFNWKLLTKMQPKLGKITPFWNLFFWVAYFTEMCYAQELVLLLRRPLYFFSSRTGQHATPAQLQQYYLRCPATSKPLAVLHLLDGFSGVDSSQSLEP